MFWRKKRIRKILSGHEMTANEVYQASNFWFMPTWDLLEMERDGEVSSRFNPSLGKQVYRLKINFSKIAKADEYLERCDCMLRRSLALWLTGVACGMLLLAAIQWAAS